jgi:hypothetical protein
MGSDEVAGAVDDNGSGVVVNVGVGADDEVVGAVDDNVSGEVVNDVVVPMKSCVPLMTAQCQVSLMTKLYDEGVAKCKVALMNKLWVPLMAMCHVKL